MPRLHRFLVLAVLPVFLLASRGHDGGDELRLEIDRPREGAIVKRCQVKIRVEVEGAAGSGALSAELNGRPLSLASRGRQDERFEATVGGRSLVPGSNTLVVHLDDPDAGMLTEQVSFEYAPPGARAKRIEEREDLIRGPLAQGRIGDWLLENCQARFVIQDAGKRDLHSVAQYGGNIIDAEVVGRPGRDQFLELQPALNVETVLNAQDIEIVNDGRNGQPAVLRACGPDDLLDYINPSSVAADFGLLFPVDANDRDTDVEACTEYSLASGTSHLRLETFVMNPAPEPIRSIVGDYVNGAGSLEQWTPPSGGVGEIAVTPATGPASASAQSYFGFGSAEGVDYSVVPVEFGPIPTSSFTQAGVTFVAQSNSIVLIFLGFEATFLVPGATGGVPGINSFVRFFGVGTGSPSHAVDLRAEVLGLDTGRIRGCVSIAGEPAPGARVAVGPTSAGIIEALASLFVTDETGCYEGTLAPGSYAAAATALGVPFEGGGTEPALRPVSILAGQTTADVDFDLPATARLRVRVTDQDGLPIPARVSVVGFDPSPEPRLVQSAFIGLVTTGLFRDVTKDGLSFGLTRIEYAGADGRAEVPLEPGTYRVFVSRGTEYSAFDTEVTLAAGTTTLVTAQIAHVLDTSGFISSDFHVHMLNSPDSRIGLKDRVLSFAGEGVDNIIATDHDAHTDLLPTIRALGLEDFVHATVGEEITTFDYGHYNAYPQRVDSGRPSGGSTDWAGAAPPGQDFPSFGHFGLTPAQIEAAAETAPLNAGLETVVQINHISSHFEPLKIDTSLASGPTSLLTDAEKAAFRLCSLEIAGSCAAAGELFHPFAALELWNGSSVGEQRQFLDERIGIWMNLLNQGFPTTAISSTDTHTFNNLAQAGARTWTPAFHEEPARIRNREISRAVRSGKAVAGQGLYVQARLLATDGSEEVADFSRRGMTGLPVANGEVDLEIHVQAPLWAGYDTIQVYSNATTCVTGGNGGVPVLFTARPLLTLHAGVSDQGSEFAIHEVVDVPAVAGAGHQETRRTLRLSGLTEDAWFVVVVKGTPGISEPMFPIFADNLSAAGNTTLDDLLDGNLGEGGVNALGFTNALYVDVDGGGFEAPGVPPLASSCL